MTTQLLLAGVLAGIATYYGTHTESKNNYKDEIILMRKDVKEFEKRDEQIKQKINQENEFSKYKRQSGKEKNNSWIRKEQLVNPT
jgi:hypothetical protein